MANTPRSSSLNVKENKLANEAKKRTLAILNDALKKKDALLLDDPREFEEHEKPSHFPLISTDLIIELISHLQKVTFRKSEDPKKIAFVYSKNRDGIIYLCPKFWAQHEFLELDSRPETLIKMTLRLIGYRNNEENTDISACPIEQACSIVMNHSTTYINGLFSCCGERSMDSVCENSLVSVSLRALRDAKPVLSRAEDFLEHVITKQSIRKRKNTARLVGKMLERVKKMRQSPLL
ncbi:uncharacterized protein LOC143923884 [Lithobates pipiens]